MVLCIRAILRVLDKEEEIRKRQREEIKKVQKISKTALIL